MFFDSNFRMNNLLKMPNPYELVSEANFGKETTEFQEFTNKIDNALDTSTPLWARLPNPESMHPMNIYALIQIVQSAKENLRILTTSFPEYTKHGIEFFHNQQIVSSLIAAAKSGVKIDIILRRPDEFDPLHPLRALDSSSKVNFYDAVDVELENCKCRYTIADTKAYKFRNEVNEKSTLHDEVEIVINSTTDDVKKLIQNFEFLIADSRFTAPRNFEKTR